MEPAIVDAPNFPNQQHQGAGSVFTSNFLSGQTAALFLRWLWFLHRDD